MAPPTKWDSKIALSSLAPHVFPTTTLPWPGRWRLGSVAQLISNIVLHVRRRYANLEQPTNGHQTPKAFRHTCILMLSRMAISRHFSPHLKDLSCTDLPLTKTYTWMRKRPDKREGPNYRAKLLDRATSAISSITDHTGSAAYPNHGHIPFVSPKILLKFQNCATTLRLLGTA